MSLGRLILAARPAGKTIVPTHIRLCGLAEQARNFHPTFLTEGRVSDVDLDHVERLSELKVCLGVSGRKYKAKSPQKMQRRELCSQKRYRYAKGNNPRRLRLDVLQNIVIAAKGMCASSQYCLTRYISVQLAALPIQRSTMR